MTDNENMKQRFDHLEKRLEALAVSNPPSTFQSPPSRSNEIDLRELFAILWQGKWWFFGITVLFSVAGVFYALSLPSMYTSEGVYIPAKKAGPVNGLAGQFGGLAALAGISMGGGGNNDIEQAIALATSWPFLEKLVKKYDLKPLILGVNGWDQSTDKIIWNEDVYNLATNKWIGKVNSENEGAEPTSYETYLALRHMIKVNHDPKTGLLNIAVEYYSPKIASDWVSLIVNELNQHFKSRDKIEAQRSINFLQDKISHTSIADMHAVFYEMIESQMKTLMLTEVGEQYLIKTVVEPKPPERQSRPRRKTIVILFAFWGGMISVIVVALRRVKI